MTNDRVEHTMQQGLGPQTAHSDNFLPRLRAYLTSLPDVRLAYYQDAQAESTLVLSGLDHPRVVLAFTRNVSSEHVEKRLAKVRKHFAALPEPVEFTSLDTLDYRECCEVAFNGAPVYGSPEAIERDRLYRYNVFLEWNAGKKFSGLKQDQPPTLLPMLDRPPMVVGVERFITPIYRHLKLIEGHLRELRRLTAMNFDDFSADDTLKSLAESYLLKGIQSAVLITMSVMHRTMRLAARDYRDLFLLMPVYGMCARERAGKFARCAEIRDRLMFQYDEISAVEVYQNANEVVETLQDFKSFMLGWMFEHYYGPSGELVQSE